MGRHSACLLLYDGNRFLLQHRAEDSTRSPGKWGFFGGGIDEGETPEQALVREIQEELGFTVEDYSFLFSQECQGSEGSYTIYLFVEQYVSQQLVLGEGQGMDWFTVEEAEKLVLCDGHLSILQRAAKMLL